MKSHKEFWKTVFWFGLAALGMVATLFFLSIHPFENGKQEYERKSAEAARKWNEAQGTDTTIVKNEFVKDTLFVYRDLYRERKENNDGGWIVFGRTSAYDRIAYTIKNGVFVQVGRDTARVVKVKDTVQEVKEVDTTIYVGSTTKGVIFYGGDADGKTRWRSDLPLEEVTMDGGETWYQKGTLPPNFKWPDATPLVQKPKPAIQKKKKKKASGIDDIKTRFDRWNQQIELFRQLDEDREEVNRFQIDSSNQVGRGYILNERNFDSLWRDLKRKNDSPQFYRDTIHG